MYVTGIDGRSAPPLTGEQADDSIEEVPNERLSVRTRMQLRLPERRSLPVRRRLRLTPRTCHSREEPPAGFPAGGSLRRAAGPLLLALVLGDLRFRCSGAVSSCAWWSSLVVIGHCRAAWDGPGTARLRHTRLAADTLDAPRLNLSRRQSAMTAGAPTDQARVCLAAPPQASATLPLPSTTASPDGEPAMTLPEPSAREARVLQARKRY